MTRYFLNTYIVAICGVLMLPIVIVVILAFGNQSFLQFPPAGYSLRWFHVLFDDSNWINSMIVSLKIALICSAISTVVGFLAAYALVRGRFRGKMLLLVGMMIPMIVPSVVTSIAMYFFAAQIDTVGNTLWIALCHSIIALPVVLLIMLSAMQSVDANLERAAYSLGAGKMRVLLKVVVPLTSPGIISSAFFAFLSSFDELLISLFLSGVRNQTLPVRIWNSLEYNVEPTIAAVSALLIVLTLVILAIDAGLRYFRKPMLKH